MTWLPETAPGATPLDRTFGLRSDAYARFKELYGGLWDPTVIDPRILELCRLRIATILGSTAERAIRFRDATDAGVTEPDVSELSRWPTSESFTDCERACIAFAEQYVMDPHELTDAHFDALHAHLDAPALSTLTLAVAMFDALTRFRLALGVEPIGPEPTAVPGPGLVPASLP
jgi:alkylhydroperoxidase family enzyme